MSIIDEPAPSQQEEYHKLMDPIRKLEDSRSNGASPLAARIRPQTIDEVVGQEHLVGEGKPLRVAVEKKHRF